MVADKVEVYSKSQKPDSKGYKWTSDGSVSQTGITFFSIMFYIMFNLFRSGVYEIAEAENVQPGTKIVVHLKPSEVSEFADATKVEGRFPLWKLHVCTILIANSQM